MPSGWLRLALPKVSCSKSFLKDFVKSRLILALSLDSGKTETFIGLGTKSPDYFDTGLTHATGYWGI